MTVTTNRTRRLAEARTLQQFFDFDLHALPGEKPDISGEHEGEFIVNSEGTVTGDIRGKIKMTFFAKDCAYLLVKAGIEPTPDRHLCYENDAGVIQTADGAKIHFDTKGYGLRGADPAYPKKWRLAMTVQYSTDNHRYQWLNSAFGFWEGQFDEEAGRASYKSYVQRYD